MFKIECGECRKKQEQSRKRTLFRNPMLIMEQYTGDTLQDAYGKFVAHVAEKHPELMGQDYCWESRYIIYEAVPNVAGEKPNA